MFFYSTTNAADNPSKGTTKAATGKPNAVSIPNVLTEKDASLYRRIFKSQKRGAWRRANKLVAKLDNQLLLGHVRAQRYLHPTKYRSQYIELARWMKIYSDHPDARRIYRLALRRKPKNFRHPVRPYRKFFPSYQPQTIIENSNYRPTKGSARRVIWKVRKMVQRQRLTAALRYISGNKIQRILGQTGYDLARTHIASGWFFYGNGKKAFRLASAVAARSGKKIPYACWIAGLSAYRLGDFAGAAGHFERVALSYEVTGFDQAGAAFWAARANMTGHRPERVNKWLKVATAHPQTFYGILARRWLGGNTPFNWNQEILTQKRLDRLLAEKSGRRALALLQVGLKTRAERELRFMAHSNDHELTKSLIAIANIASLPMVSYRAGIALLDAGVPIPAAALYPIPEWLPREGFRIDRALIFAFMRQESAFNVRAKSPAGARGLMQLMPATAEFIAQKRFRGRRRDLLYGPALNISLGQKYIQHLLDTDHINGDLLLLTAAYNGGPGNLKKWQRRARKGAYTDPLMFIESIPARETRIFIERVLANLWMYRERLGEPAPSLDGLATGGRPFYIAVDGQNGSVGEDVRN
ncbi:MAG: lytic transglycosylase domain-containing protein [Pseudomonadota bacterium]|nr:lytic transglycosylase domain-containing protein [Pseudomonadota bacterium]